ncbi:MAG: hypothetical protein P0Y50_15500 [Candidatus Brevundimonas colombiensis]|uniref:Uncharacterized protein n=1 Tax=Candidatus Brevundimonas colombiensis TaxID=3121376 RepID=A0AAJ6BK09_9CAUL|nr:hypothetical protein [Brevundimonas sp.]WEK39918.1 MAG: hypothetical protein P0Y50_15500 [Brevundimonas sp.]
MKSRILAAVAALLFSTAVAAPALAQDAGTHSTDAQSGVRAPAQAVAPSRIRARNNEPRRERAPAAPTAEQILAAAQEQMSQTATGCQVSEAKLLGKTAAGTTVYEVACGAAPGYMLETKTPPEASSCIILAHTAEQRRAADPAADVGPQCTIAANTDTQKFLREYAKQASVPCTVDQAKILGQSGDGAVVYEIGCSDAAGYWIKQEAGAWTKTPCIQVLAESGKCDFTTTAENAGYVKTLLAGSEAAPCNVSEARLMGRNANGVFYEAKCDGADGVIARLNAENVVQQIYPCATAQQIGGGCKLTAAPAAAAPAPAGGRP